MLLSQYICYFYICIRRGKIGKPHFLQVVRFVTCNKKNVAPVSDSEMTLLKLRKTEEYLRNQVLQLSDDMERLSEEFLLDCVLNLAITCTVQCAITFAFWIFLDSCLHDATLLVTGNLNENNYL